MFNTKSSMFIVQRRKRNYYYNIFLLLTSYLLLASCSLQKKLATAAKEDLIESADLKSAHIGISIYEPAANKFWYNYQSDKFFTPASNTKIFSCYAGMKYLGDSLPGLRYTENGKDLFIQGTGDPSFLHAGYKYQPVVSFYSTAKKIFTSSIPTGRIMHGAAAGRGMITILLIWWTEAHFLCMAIS